MKCTCHPDEALVPCAKRYAYSECVLVAEIRDKDQRIKELASEAIAATTRYQDAENDLHNARTLLRKALAALEPFRQFAAEDLDQDRPDLPDDCGIYAFKAGDFRRARTLSDRIKKELPDAE